MNNETASSASRSRLREWSRRAKPAAVPMLAIGAALAVTASGMGGTSVSSSEAASIAVKRNIDTSHLKLGDGRVTTSGPKRGWVYSCQASFAPAPSVDGPWIDGKSWDATAKPTVSGSVDWSNATFKVKRKGSKRKLSGNGLPDHATGVFPISSSDDAYQYDRNPNSIRANTINVVLPAHPKKASSASCVGLGMIGVLDSGAALFNALDAGGEDAGAHEIQDSCSGHPQRQGVYHYHTLPSCLKTGNKHHHSKRIGWALDGYPIYGPRGKHGRYMTNDKLDKCHGAWHTVKRHGKRKRIYGYYATMQYPYTIGCFKGTPITTAPGA